MHSSSCAMVIIKLVLRLGRTKTKNDDEKGLNVENVESICMFFYTFIAQLKKDEMDEVKVK